MTLSKRSVEMLLHILESLISSMDALDPEDIRDLQILQQCREELQGTIDAGTSFDDLAIRGDAARTIH